jgi:hypothetical protein
MQLILRLEAHPAELGSRKKLEIKLMAEDGQTVLTMGAELGFDRVEPVRPLGEALRSDQIIGFGNVRFETPGNYQFAILINDETRSIVPLRVRQRPRPDAAPDPRG